MESQAHLKYVFPLPFGRLLGQLNGPVAVLVSLPLLVDHLEVEDAEEPPDGQTRVGDMLLSLYHE